MVSTGRVADGVRNARCWVRRVFDLVFGGKSPGGAYVPDHQGRRLRAALAPEEDITTGAVERSAEIGKTSVPAILLRARERFGRRFFVSPEAIPALWQRLRDEYPEWCERQMEAVRTDAETGIPIYSQRGPRIGVDFPWDGLCPVTGNDGLYAKRPHRFAFAPRHALACHQDTGAVARLRGMLEGWMDRARGGDDRHCYGSNLVVIQRLLALSWSWVFLAGCGTAASDEQQALEWTVLRMIEADIRFLESRLGHSAPNNHLLADRFVAWYLRAVFPELLDTDGDGNEETRWRDELLRQTYPDGGGFEHSAHYHELACEMGCAYLLLCRRQGRSPDPAIASRVEELLHFQAALTGPEAVPLPFGNGIEDTLFPLDPDEGWCPGSLRELYRALFQPGLEPTPTDNPSWVRAFWLLGGDLADAPVDSAAPAAMESFPDSGFHVMFDADMEARLIYRTGPRPGVPVMSGHMHADHLSISMSVTGTPLIVDPGTYTYRISGASPGSNVSPWRQYFGGPRAHNALVFDDRDPLGELTADFRHSGEDVRAVTDHDACPFLSMVDGWLRADTPYHGHRRIVIHVYGHYWLVVDVPPADAEHVEAASHGFQFNSDVRVTQRRNGVSIESPECPDIVSLVACPNCDRSVVYQANTDPVAGWMSPRYGELRPAPQACFAITDPTAPIAFLVHAKAMETDSAIDIHMAEDEGMDLTVSHGKYTDIVFVRSALARKHRLGGCELRFSGDLLWLRTADEAPCEARWLGAEHLSIADLSIESDTYNMFGQHKFR